jgi:hypothetical protein
LVGGSGGSGIGVASQAPALFPVVDAAKTAVNNGFPPSTSIKSSAKDSAPAMPEVKSVNK